MDKDPLDAAQALQKALDATNMHPRDAYNIRQAIENLIDAKIDEALKQAALRL